jgi:sigma-B regulation protein RsbU (phosphoserine phosphatase)
VLSPYQKDLDDRLSRFELKTLIDSTKLIIESQDLNFILNTLLFMIMGNLMITRALILLRDADEDMYSVAKTKGRSHFSEGQQFHLQISTPTPNNSPVRTWVKDRDQFPQMFANEGYRVMINLRTNNEHLGWLCLGEKPSGLPISDRELEFLESIVAMPAVGIANTRLINELKHTNRALDQKVQELNTLFDLSKEFSLNVDRDQILRIFKFSLMGQIGVRNFFLLLERNKQLEVIVKNAISVLPTQEELRSIFSIDGEMIGVDDTGDAKQVLLHNGIEIVLHLKLQNQRVASLCLGSRMGGEPFNSSDTDYLVSLGSLLLLSVQKTYLIEARIEKERLEKEIGLARTIQEALLPSSLPDTSPVDISPRNIPSRQVGGDYYDVIDLGGRTFLLTIADVTGKGIPASLVMANVQAMVHMLAPLDMPLSEKTARINDVIYQNTPSDTFVTFFWGILDCNDLSLNYVNAGHNPPMIFREGFSKPIELTKGGVILGAVPTHFPYECERVELKLGDILVMFTDGITEAMSPDEVEFGNEGIITVMRETNANDSSSYADAIIHAIDVFTNRKYSDDVTLMTLKVGE